MNHRELATDHPARKAFEAFTQTEAYRTACVWVKAPAHAEASFWTAFEAGYEAALPGALGNAAEPNVGADDVKRAPAKGRARK